MLNPITDKLLRMHLKRKQSASRNRKQKNTATPLKFLQTRIDSRFKGNSNKQNDPLLSNTSKTSITPWKLTMQRQSSFLSQSAQQKLQQCLKDNQNLLQQIKTHEQMQQFYLKQLELQKKEKKNLEWRLSILGEQLKTNIYSKLDRNKPKQPQP